MFRHFVDLASLEEKERESLRVLCLVEDRAEMELLIPLALGEDFVLVELDGSASFMVNHRDTVKLSYILSLSAGL